MSPHTSLIWLSLCLRTAAAVDYNCSFVYTDFCLSVGYDMVKPDKLPINLDMDIYVEVSNSRLIERKSPRMVPNFT